MLDCDNEYLLIDDDGNATLTNNKPRLDFCSWPLKFRVSGTPESYSYVLEKLNANNEWEGIEVDNDK